MLRQGEQFGAPPPLPASAPVAELAAGVQSLLRIFASHGYALDVRAAWFGQDLTAVYAVAACAFQSTKRFEFSTRQWCMPIMTMSLSSPFHSSRKAVCMRQCRVSILPAWSWFLPETLTGVLVGCRRG